MHHRNMKFGIQSHNPIHLQNYKESLLFSVRWYCFSLILAFGIYFYSLQFGTVCAIMVECGMVNWKSRIIYSESSIRGFCILRTVNFLCRHFRNNDSCCISMSFFVVLSLFCDYIPCEPSLFQYKQSGTQKNTIQKIRPLDI